MNRFFPLLLIVLLGCAERPVLSSAVQIIPRPSSLNIATGSFVLSDKTALVINDQEDQKAADFFNDYLQQYYGFRLKTARAAEKNFISIYTKKFIQPSNSNAYSLEVSPNNIAISGDTYPASFYGMQTLIQLLPAVAKKNPTFKIPALNIVDSPRFDYRGMHLDVSRHFFDVNFVKKYIDYLALHKMNFFHWHLTDDQGWRIEIKKYPELSQTGGWRNGTIIGRYPGIDNDNTRYGGYYTQSEIKEVVQYAAMRHITVIPEIEMPGHSSAAIASYPWLSCFPQQPTVIPYHPSNKSTALQNQGVNKLVQETWGVFEDIFCAGSDSTFMFLESVLDEVLQLFPSPYIHIGGDEAPKINWKNCPKCQLRIKQLGLKDEHELQSYFIQRIEKYVNSKGRKIIGWDEILEGGLAPNAVVMSWRGERGGISAANEHHQVIMTPQKPVYFDHSQTRNEDSLVWGGYNPLEAVYLYDPVPKELDSSRSKYVLGAQANVWTEYMAYPSKVEYMVFPRMSALAEVLWTGKVKRDVADFEKRLQEQFRRYDLWGASYSKAYYDVKVKLDTAANGVTVTAIPKDAAGKLTYTVNGKEQNYTAPFVLSQSGELSINYYRDNRLLNKVSYQVTINKATGKKISIEQKPQDNYPGQHGAFSLVNGIYSNRGLSFPDWLGFIGDDLTATIDLGRSTNVSRLSMHTLDQNGSWVYLPQYIEVSLSVDGKTFVPAGRTTEFVKDTLTMGWMTVNFAETPARYIRLHAKNYGMIPEGKPGVGNKAWLFADEIQVY